MVDLRVKIEQVETRNKLVKLVDYINSAEFFKQSEDMREILMRMTAGIWKEGMAIVVVV